jgi:hypothetical protein
MLSSLIFVVLELLKDMSKRVFVFIYIGGLRLRRMIKSGSLKSKLHLDYLYSRRAVEDWLWSLSIGTLATLVQASAMGIDQILKYIFL